MRSSQAAFQNEFISKSMSVLDIKCRCYPFIISVDDGGRVILRELIINVIPNRLYPKIQLVVLRNFEFIIQLKSNVFQIVVFQTSITPNKSSIRPCYTRFTTSISLAKIIGVR